MAQPNIYSEDLSRFMNKKAGILDMRAANSADCLFDLMN